MAPRRQVPLLLLTGFLGSGKTTLLRNWLAEPAFADTMVVVNEIGEVGIDQQLLAPSAGEAVLLENGCACCDAGGDLVAALEQLFFDRLHRKIPSFARVVIETTGLASPSSVLRLLGASEILRERYGAPVVLATFDATRGPAQFERHPEVRDQIGVADAIVLTRTDLASDLDLAAATALLNRERPDVAVLASGRETAPAASVLQALEQPRARVGAAAEPRDAIHSPDVSTSFAPIPDAVTEAALAAALDALFRDAGASVLRVKGVVELAAIGPCAAHAEAGRLAWEPAPGAADRRGLTIIAQGRRADDLAASLSAKLAIRRLGR